MIFPIPDAALDGRLGIVGLTGSGKTNVAKCGVERLLRLKRRVCIVDLLDAWWGLRLDRAAEHAAFDIAIFGGTHGDLPIGDQSGAVVGQAVAESSASTIVSLDRFDSDEARRRFARAFFDALHRFNHAPLHLIIDEADFYAPQNPLKESNASFVLNRVKEITSRGRMRGFRAWAVTQRPAKLHKDVLSQCDTLIAMQLTSSQDRDAIDGWIGDQADRKTGKDILATLPRLKLGQGILWSPRLGILRPEFFPLSETYDSSKTPEYGKEAASVALAPLDVNDLRERLATVVIEAEANDPRRLKARIVELERALASQPKAGLDEPTVKRMLADAESNGRVLGYTDLAAKIGPMKDRYLVPFLEELHPLIDKVVSQPTISFPLPKGAVGVNLYTGDPPRKIAELPSSNGLDPSAKLKPSLQRVVDAIGWWSKIGKHPIPRDRACVVAGLSPKASTFGVYVAELVRMGLVESTLGFVGLTAEGFKHAAIPAAATRSDLYDCAAGLLAPQERKIFDIVYAAYPQDIRRDKVAEKAGLSPTASTAGVYMAAVAAYGIIEPAQRGCVRAADWLFP